MRPRNCLIKKELVEAQKIASDSELVKEIRKGSELAFSHLVSRYKNQIAKTVMGMLGNTPEAEDIGQETFIRFYGAIDDFRGDAAVGTYLTRIAINLSLNELKKRKRTVSLFAQNNDDELREIEPGDDREEQDRDLRQLFRWALEKIEAHQKTVVVLRMIEGYSTKETAEILDLPIGTVLSRLARAQSHLKRILKDHIQT
jgi:RNA polymerase sigma-70 factor, ECF subfamily